MNAKRAIGISPIARKVDVINSYFSKIIDDDRLGGCITIDHNPDDVILRVNIENMDKYSLSWAKVNCIGNVFEDIGGGHPFVAMSRNGEGYNVHGKDLCNLKDNKIKKGEEKMAMEECDELYHVEYQ